MCQLRTTPTYEARLRRYAKKRRTETQNALRNLNTYHQALLEGTNPLQISFGFLHHERQGVYAVDQRPGGNLTQLRLYFYPRPEAGELWLLTIGEKGTQRQDIQDCRDMVRDILTQSGQENEREEEPPGPGDGCDPGEDV